jgi:alkylated DNA repair dioxygenase AlkB
MTDKEFKDIGLKDCDVLYCENYFEEEADKYFRRINDEVKWDIFQVMIYGKMINQPRKSFFMGNEGRIYNYSKIDRLPVPWSRTMNKINNVLEQLSEEIKIPEVNACLGNMYDDGNNYICFHSDNINKLIKNSYIISVTLGQERI